MAAKEILNILRVGLLLAVASVAGCSDRTSGDACPLPEPYCGTAFPLNTAETTPYGPPWANVTYGDNGWAACFGPYALCYYANCEPAPDGLVSDCPCYDWYGTSFVQINSILNADAYQETRQFCDANPGLCLTPNTAPVCDYINSGTFMAGTSRISTFSFYRATVEPIGLTNCSDDPGLYSGCMTAACFGEPVIDPATGTAILSCECPNFDGPFQAGKSGLSCDNEPMTWSAAYNPSTLPTSFCDIIPGGCIPDAPAEDCGCPLYAQGTTLPPGSGIDCATVCEQYASCTGVGGIELGYTCDATICTSDDRDLVLAACSGLEGCDLSEVFAAEKAAGCSCCATQLCGCDANPQTDVAVAASDAAQRAQGETPQCDINGTLCGLPQ